MPLSSRLIHQAAYVLGRSLGRRTAGTVAPRRCLAPAVPAGVAEGRGQADVAAARRAHQTCRAVIFFIYLCLLLRRICSYAILSSLAVLKIHNIYR